jgi:serine/threonine-protein kinase SRPK3
MPYNCHIGPSSSDNLHVAIKILTGYATRMNREQKLRELEILQLLSSVTPESPYNHCAHLLTQFVHPGIDDKDEEHLCLVTKLFVSSVEDTQNALPDERFPVEIAKRIFRHVLRGITCLHKRGIAHTGMFVLLRDFGDGSSV